MTLYDLERQNRGFMDFLAISGCNTISFTKWRHAIIVMRFR